MQSSPPSYKKKRHVTCKIQTVIRLSERSELLLSAVWSLIKECMSLASKSSSWSCTPSRGRTKEVAVIYCTVCFLIYRVNEYSARQCWMKWNHKKDDTSYCNCEQVYSENWVLLLWTYCPPTSYTTAPPCGNWNRPPCLSFGSVWSVPWILTTCPCRCFWTARSWWTRGLTPLRFHQIQRTPRTILCHVSSCPISSERLQWLKQFTVIQMFSLFHYNIGSIQKDLLHTCIDSDLRGKEFLEGGEDATVWNNHRCMNLHFFLTFPHFHTWKEVFSQLRIFCLQQMKN